jgi:hypothetical protein
MSVLTSIVTGVGTMIDVRIRGIEHWLSILVLFRTTESLPSLGPKFLLAKFLLCHTVLVSGKLLRLCLPEITKRFKF